MKRIALIFICFSVTHFSSAQRPCKVLPTAQQLYAGLQYKPAFANPSNFLQGCNVNDSVKNRLLYLLNWQWTQQEMADYLDRDIKSGFEMDWIDKTAKEIAKGNDSVYKAASDSLIARYKQDRLKYISTVPTYTMVDPGIILTVGALDMKEAMPILQNALKDSVHYDRYAVQSALARLGDTAMQKILYSYFSKPYASFPNAQEAAQKIARLAYIATPQSICMISNWLDTTSLYARFLAEPPAPAQMELVASDVIKLLRGIVRNIEFQNICKEYQHITPPHFKPGDKNVIIKAKNWLLQNQDKYQINRNYYTHIY